MLTQAEQTLIQNALNSVDGKSPVDKIGNKATNAADIKKAFDAITDDNIFAQIENDDNFEKVIGAIEELRTYYTAKRNMTVQNEDPKVRAEERAYLKAYLEGRRDYFVKERAKKEGKVQNGQDQNSLLDLTKTHDVRKLSEAELDRFLELANKVKAEKSALPQQQAASLVPNPNPAPQAAPAQPVKADLQLSKTFAAQQQAIQDEIDARLMRPAPQAAAFVANPAPQAPAVKGISQADVKKFMDGLHPMPKPKTVSNDQLLQFITQENRDDLEFVVTLSITGMSQTPLSKEFYAFKQAADSLAGEFNNPPRDTKIMEENYKAALENALQITSDAEEQAMPGATELKARLEALKTNIEKALVPLPPRDVVMPPQPPKAVVPAKPVVIDSREMTVEEINKSSLAAKYMRQQGCGEWEVRSWVEIDNATKKVKTQSGLVSFAGNFKPVREGVGATTETAQKFTASLNLTKTKIMPASYFIDAKHLQEISLNPKSNKLEIDPKYFIKGKMLWLPYSEEDFTRLSQLGFLQVRGAAEAIRPANPAHEFDVATKPLQQSDEKTFNQMQKLQPYLSEAIKALLQKSGKEKHFFFFGCLKALNEGKQDFEFFVQKKGSHVKYYALTALKELDFSEQLQEIKAFAKNTRFDVSKIEGLEKVIKEVIKEEGVVLPKGFAAAQPAPNPAPSPFAPKFAPVVAPQPNPDPNPGIHPVGRIRGETSVKQPGGLVAGLQLQPKAPGLFVANAPVPGRRLSPPRGESHAVEFSVQQRSLGGSMSAYEMTIKIPNADDRNRVKAFLLNKSIFIKNLIELELKPDSEDIIISSSNRKTGCYRAQGTDKEFAIAFPEPANAREFMVMMGLKYIPGDRANSDAWNMVIDRDAPKKEKGRLKEVNVVYFNPEKLNLGKAHTSNFVDGDIAKQPVAARRGFGQ